MKKSIIYIGVIAMSLGLTACDEDFTDWAKPQTNPQEPAAGAVTVVTEQGEDAVVTLPLSEDHIKVKGDSVDVINYVSCTDGNVKEVVPTQILVNGEYSLPFVQHGNVMRVAAAKIDSISRLAYNSRACVQRDMKLQLKTQCKTNTGTSYLGSGNEVDLKFTPVPTPEREASYYLVGGFNNWALDKSVPMVDKGNGVYEAVVTAGADCYWKIFGEKAVDAQDWGQALGNAVNGNEASTGFVTWNDGAEPQAMKIAAEGDYVITFDAVNYTYRCVPKTAELYFTGDHYAWSNWNIMVPVNGNDGHFWAMLYADAGEQIKFAPQASWGGDFAGDMVVDHANSGAAPADGNLKFANAGWYLLYVDANAKGVEIYAPEVYMMGDCVGGWDELKAENLFSVPEGRDGDFVSPVFANDGEMRMYVKPKVEIDWWRMEFVPIDGQIVFRGNDGDQQRVAAKAGQRLYLNFTNGTGVVK